MTPSGWQSTKLSRKHAHRRNERSGKEEDGKFLCYVAVKRVGCVGVCDVPLVSASVEIRLLFSVWNSEKEMEKRVS